MKKILLSFTLLTITFSFAQNSEFTLTKDGFTDYIVVNVPNKTAGEIYNKTNQWISKTFNNPKEVIKADIKDDYIRFQGIKENLYCYSPLGMPVCYDVRYQIEVHFKENKYKFDIIEMEEYVKPSQYSSGGWRNFMVNNNTELFFKKDGTLKGGYKNYVPNIPIYFNDLNKSLLDYINNTGVQAEKNDW